LNLDHPNTEIYEQSGKTSSTPKLQRKNKIEIQQVKKDHRKRRMGLEENHFSRKQPKVEEI
jgi:hypothetical protein